MTQTYLQKEMLLINLLILESLIMDTLARILGNPKMMKVPEIKQLIFKTFYR